MKVFGLAVLMAAAMICFINRTLPAQASQPLTTPIQQDCTSPYRVKTGDTGDTLHKIANRCAMSLGQILEENPQIEDANTIDPGQRIYLPSVNTAPAIAIPVTGNSSATAAEIQPGETYAVRAGDSLLKIAKNHNLSIEVLMLANPAITNPNLIYPGQSLRIPSEAEIEQLKSEKEKLEEQRQQAVVAAVKHNNERWIDVDLAAQKVRAYEGDQLVRTFIVSTGTSRTPTVTGQYNIWIKLRYDHMRGPGYDLKDVPYVMYFYKGYGLHGTYWHNNFGTPMSHGCVNLATEDAAWLYDFASVGTLVNVH